MLIEEPELSLHEAVIEQLPILISGIQRRTKQRRQMIISTHSETMLNNKGIDYRGLVVLTMSPEGPVVRSVNEAERKGLDAGFSIAEVVMPQTRPKKMEQMRLWE